jgi:hypothetical protein
MKTAFSLLITLGAFSLASCSVSVRQSHLGIDSIASDRMIGNADTADHFFVTGAQYDSLFDSIQYKTRILGNVWVPNTRSQNALFGTYAPGTHALLWIAYGYGRGDGRACTYSISRAEDAVFIMGYFSDSTRFSYNDGSAKSALLVAQGKTDMFLAKYRYSDGRLLWINGGGTAGRDVGYSYLDPHGFSVAVSETRMRADSVVHTCTRCFDGGNMRFEDSTADADSTAFMEVMFNKTNGTINRIRSVKIKPKY